MAEAAQVRIALIAGVWRAWRLPLDGFGVPDAGLGLADEVRPSAAIDPDDPGGAHRVYVVQVLDGAVAPALTGELRAPDLGHDRPAHHGSDASRQNPAGVPPLGLGAPG
jgi:hypothetical protein